MTTLITSREQRFNCEGMNLLHKVQRTKENYNRDIESIVFFFDTEEEIMKHAQKELSRLPEKTRKEILSAINK